MLGVAAMCFIAEGIASIPLAIIIVMLAMLDFRDAKRGWKMQDDRPPWADQHDAIDAKWNKKRK